MTWNNLGERKNSSSFLQQNVNQGYFSQILVHLRKHVMRVSWKIRTKERTMFSLRDRCEIDEETYQGVHFLKNL